MASMPTSDTSRTNKACAANGPVVVAKVVQNSEAKMGPVLMETSNTGGFRCRMAGMEAEEASFGAKHLKDSPPSDADFAGWRGINVRVPSDVDRSPIG
ncbi:UNVERIFIED_CONTAM: hypothetical protein K2H54_051755 [Gekko kuhli]